MKNLKLIVALFTVLFLHQLKSYAGDWKIVITNNSKTTIYINSLGGYTGIFQHPGKPIGESMAVPVGAQFVFNGSVTPFHGIDIEFHIWADGLSSQDCGYIYFHSPVSGRDITKSQAREPFSLRVNKNWEQSRVLEYNFTGTNTLTPLKEGAQVYENCGYDFSKNWYIKPGLYANFKNIPNDAISAVGVTPGYSIELFENENFKGRSLTLTESSDCLNSFNDITSSMIVKKIGEFLPGEIDPDAIHAMQAFTTLLKEDKYVAQNIGKLKGMAFASSNSNPNFGNGYCCGATLNDAFCYSSTKQGRDHRTAIWGPILEKWGTYNREHGDMGWPVSSVAPIKDNGQFAFFQNGSIYYKATTGAHVVKGSVKSTFEAAKSENGELGYPKTDEIEIFANRIGNTGKKIGVYQVFEGGIIYYKWDGGRPAIIIKGKILDQYLAAGGPRSTFGWPLGAERKEDDKYKQDFERGSLERARFEKMKPDGIKPSIKPTD
ncbi:hypothetical protein EZJ43_11475 [Pedobacter changchengzhani]|uniref:Beta/gamma crystallin 'Greek key' domain-containing protein n=1 Tax=Pedobacter changchengzhani TaxID=2529274 RepID=A0A4R5MK17_9SPHI|nr:hypothetical protein [Pedobacter changchengzhani]TDG35961.1 hypothetical protein EZJ43_11475 [Pedobacter changchengzhani]